MEAIETHKKQSDAKVKAAITEHRAAHPECSEKDTNIITVIDEETKQLMLRVKERTRRLVGGTWLAFQSLPRRTWMCELDS